MKRLLVLLGLLLVALPIAPARADGYPEPDGYVVDTAGVITPALEARIEAELASFDKRTTKQVAVAVVTSLDGRPVEDYAHDLFNQWGVGQSGTNNGVLLLLAAVDHADRIQVGLGLEDVLTDGTASELLAAYVAPSAKKGNFGAAVLNTERAIRKALGDTTLTATGDAPDGDPFAGGLDDVQDTSSDPGFTYPQDSVNGYADPTASSGRTGLLFLGPVFVVIVGFLGVLARIVGIAGRGTGLTSGRGVFFGANSQGYTHRNSTSGGGGFGGGGGGMGGGGFGGGSTGGGGASGGW